MEVWQLLFAAGNVLYTEAKGARFTVADVTDDGIRIHVEKGGRVVLLTYKRLAPILDDYERLQGRISSGYGIVAEINGVWETAQVAIETTNESQYWATVCEYRRRYDAVRTLVGGA